MLADYSPPLVEYFSVPSISSFPKITNRSGPAPAIQAVPIQIPVGQLKEPFPGARGLAWALARASPVDFANVPFYLLARSQLGNMPKQKWEPNMAYIACCGRWLSENLRGPLETFGAWISPGLAILVDDRHWRPTNQQDGIGLLIHEAAHWLHQTGQAIPWSTQADTYHCLRYNAHGPEYLRAVLHLRHRVAMLGFQVPLSSLRIDNVPQPSAFHYLLETELADPRPILEIIRRRPPALFQALATERFRAGAFVVD